MQFLQTMTDVLLYGSYSFSIPLFLISTLLLVAGIIALVHSRIRITFLENKPLSWIEKTHPYLPSLRMVITIALCSSTLMLVGFQTMQNTFPFNDAYQGLNLATFFLLGGSLGILGELRWRGAGAYACAVLAGTALAFLLMILQQKSSTDALSSKMSLLALLPTFLLVGYAVNREHQRRILATAAFAFTFWMLITISR